MNILAKRFSCVVLLGLTVAFASCGQKETVVKEGPAERAGKSIDHAVAKTGEKMEEAKDVIVDKTEEAGDYMSDGYITSKIKAKIIGDPLLKVFQIKVITAEGVVTLSGEVDSFQSITRAIEVASSVKGVKSVVNELTLRADTHILIAKEDLDKKDDKNSEYLSDSYITAKIKAEILSDPLLKSFQINVTTTNSVVKLSGVVDTQQSIKRSQEIAKSIKGVKSVELELYLKKTE